VTVCVRGNNVLYFFYPDIPGSRFPPYIWTCLRNCMFWYFIPPKSTYSLGKVPHVIIVAIIIIFIIIVIVANKYYSSWNTRVALKSMVFDVFLDMTSCNLVEICWRIRGNCCLQLLGWIMLEGGDQYVLYHIIQRHISDRILNVRTTFGVADLM